MTEVKKDTFRSQGIRVCDNDNMVRVVLDMTRIEYFKHIKPLLETAHNSDYTKLPKVKDPELSKCIKNIQVAIEKLGNFA